MFEIINQLSIFPKKSKLWNYQFLQSKKKKEKIYYKIINFSKKIEIIKLSISSIQKEKRKKYTFEIIKFSIFPIQKQNRERKIEKKIHSNVRLHLSPSSRGEERGGWKKEGWYTAAIVLQLPTWWVRLLVRRAERRYERLRKGWPQKWMVLLISSIMGLAVAEQGVGCLSRLR